jgi:hypothetical protein
MVIVALVVVAGFLSMCTSSCASIGGGTAATEGSTAATDDPSLASKAQAAIAAAGGSAAVHDVSATTDGLVIVTLTLRKEDLGGEVQAEDAGTGVANTIYSAVPEAKEVGVYDANRSMIDSYTRK